jgi:CO dehydrogenase/acetyl-CoA synthase beta subunit
LQSLDGQIHKLFEYLERLEEKEQVQIREIECPSDVKELLKGLPVRVGPQEQNNIILKEDTAVELGNPSLASCAFLLWTSNLSIVRDGRITLMGPDIQEAVGSSLPFGQIMIVGGGGLKDQHHLALEQHYVISNQIEGYMIRLAPQYERMWTRVSKDVVERGFCFESLGRALMAIYKMRLPVIEAAEVVFITSSKEDVQGLQAIASDVRRIKSNILSRRFQSRQDGYYECTTNYIDCDDCPEKVVCDELRDLIHLRRKRRPSMQP